MGPPECLYFEFTVLIRLRSSLGVYCPGPGILREALIATKSRKDVRFLRLKAGAFASLISWSYCPGPGDNSALIKLGLWIEEEPKEAGRDPHFRSKVDGSS